MEYRREIDGIRALAVIPVILFHAGFSHFEGGFVGVDVFFVISCRSSDPTIQLPILMGCLSDEV